MTLKTATLVSTTSTSSLCNLTVSLIDSDTKQKEDGVEGDFLYIDSQGDALVNTYMLGTKNLWVRAVYQGTNYDSNIF